MGRELYEIRTYEALVKESPESNNLWLDISGFGAFRIPNDLKSELEIAGSMVKREGSCNVTAVLIDNSLVGIRTLDGRIILDWTSDLDIRKRGFATDALYKTTAA